MFNLSLSLATRFVGSAVLRHKKWMMAPFGGAYLSSLANKEEATHRGPSVSLRRREVETFYSQFDPRAEIDSAAAVLLIFWCRRSRAGRAQ